MPHRRQRSVHRARDARRHLALRRQQDRPGVLAEGALRTGHPQRRGLRLRRRRSPLRDAARPRPAARELAGALHGRAGLQPARRGSGAILKEGACYGWPKCYYDAEQKKLVLAPEYGGDGGKTVGDCAKAEPPVAAFPAHWAPNDLKIYKASTFPEAYRRAAPSSPSTARGTARRVRRAAITSFSSRWRMASPSGDYIVFADGFAGGTRIRAAPRTGLPVSPSVPTARSTSATTRPAASGASPMRAIPTPRASRRRRPGRQAAASPARCRPRASIPMPAAAEAAGAAGARRPGRARRQSILRRGRRRDVRRLPWRRRHRHAGRPRSDARQWLWGDGSLKSITSTIENGVQSRSSIPAPCRRWAASSFQGRSRRRLRLRLGHRPPLEGLT